MSKRDNILQELNYRCFYTEFVVYQKHLIYLQMKGFARIALSL